MSDRPNEFDKWWMEYESLVGDVIDLNRASYLSAGAAWEAAIRKRRFEVGGCLCGRDEDCTWCQPTDHVVQGPEECELDGNQRLLCQRCRHKGDKTLTRCVPLLACGVPPDGWTCSRGMLHEGPCAASPVGRKPPREVPMACCLRLPGDCTCEDKIAMDPENLKRPWYIAESEWEKRWDGKLCLTCKQKSCDCQLGLF